MIKKITFTYIFVLLCLGIYAQNSKLTGVYMINFGKPYAWESPYNKYMLAIVDSTKYDLYTKGYFEDYDYVPSDFIKVNDTFSIVLCEFFGYGDPNYHGTYIISNDSILLTTQWTTDTVCTLRIIDNYNLQVVSCVEKEFVGCVFNRTSELSQVNSNDVWNYDSYSKWIIIRQKDGVFIKRTILSKDNNSGNQSYKDEIFNPNIFINTK